MKKMFVLFALITSTTAMAANDMFVNQASTKLGQALQLVNSLETSMGPMAMVYKGSLDAIRLQISGAQTDLVMAMDPANNLPPVIVQQMYWECTTRDSFNGDKLFVRTGKTEKQARTATSQACIDAVGSFWCTNAISCEQVPQ